jgi:hypothetical protein
MQSSIIVAGQQRKDQREQNVATNAFPLDGRAAEVEDPGL